MKRMQRWLAVILVLGVSSCLTSCGRSTSYTAPVYPLDNSPEQLAQMNAATDFLSADMYALDGFTTHLPLLAIDTGGQEIAGAHDAERVPVPASVSIFDGESNQLHGEASIVLPVEIATVNHTAPKDREKADYVLTLSASEGRAPLSVLGMPADTNWLLIGSQFDKSLLRNYIAYTLASAFMDNAPAVRYCEVVIKDAEGYRYQGVYLLMENVGQFTNQYSIEQRGGDEVILRRTPTVEEGAVVTPPRDGVQGYLSLTYLDGAAPQEMLDQVGKDIQQLEQVLYSDVAAEFLSYRSYLDTDSFVDYYVINEFFANYDAGYLAFYTYQGTGKKLMIGPVGDFERALDNQMDTALDVWDMRFDEPPWYDRLVKSTGFMEKVLKRYRSLRTDVLKDRSVEDLIDSTVQYLGPAQKRDWARWEHVYTGAQYALEDYVPGQSPDVPDEDAASGAVLDSYARVRQTATYEQEIIKIKHLLREHGLYMYSALPEMMKAEDMVSSADDFYRNTLLFLGFIGLLAGSVIFVRRRTR